MHIIAEIGINHNGDINLAKKLIDISSVAGCKYVKFQKRTPELCVPEDQKNKIRETPWGKISYIEYKNKIEFGKKEYDEIDSYCKEKGIKWFASVWDKPSAEFISNYTNISKIPSALITNIELCKYTRSKFETFLVSTGMSTESQIENAVNQSKP
jgi:N-acetylneuraminate synthase